MPFKVGVAAFPLVSLCASAPCTQSRQIAHSEVLALFRKRSNTESRPPQSPPALEGRTR